MNTRPGTVQAGQVQPRMFTVHGMEMREPFQHFYDDTDALGISF